MNNKKPNIIFFFADQQRWDTIGAYGQKLPVTPNLDAMAKEGVLFQNAYTMQPVCGPARAALQTGTYPTATGCFRNNIALPQHARTIAHRFNDNGYETAYMGKWHLASNHGPESLATGSDTLDKNFHSENFDYKTKPVPEHLRGGYKDEWIASDVLEFTSHGYGGYMFNKKNEPVVWDLLTYRPDFQTDLVLDYLNNRKSDKPFFLFISYIEPHHQNDNNRYEGPIGSKEKFKDYEIPGDLVGTAGDWRENYPDYLGCCNSLDYNLGRIRKTLADLKIDDNTIIFYTADHGSHFKTRNGEYKRSCHEGCTHIPLIAYGPGFLGGKVVEDMVSLIDLPPTLLQAGGISEYSDMHGQPLQNVLAGKSSRKDVFIQISESQVGRCIRTHKWTYSVSDKTKSGWDDSSSDKYVEEFLYDLENDPFEKNNLVSESAYANVRTELRDLLLQRMVEVGEKRAEIVPIIAG